MSPIKETLPGWYTIDARHYLSWQRFAHPMLTRHSDGHRVPARILPPGPEPVLPSGRLSCHGPVARVSAGYRTHQREVERERVTERYA